MIAEPRKVRYNTAMIIIRFIEPAAERRALGYLAGKFSFKSWASGEMMVPAQALPFLALEGISFFVVGPATDEQLTATVGNPTGVEVP